MGDRLEELAKQMGGPQQAATPAAPQQDMTKLWDQQQPAQQRTGLEHENYNPALGIKGNIPIAARNFGRGMLQVPYGIGKALTSDPRETVKEMYTNPANIDPTGQIPTLMNMVNGRGAEETGNIVGGLLLGKGAEALGEGVGGMTSIRPYKTPLIPETEAYARKLFDTLGIDPAARSSSVSTLGQHAPLLRQYLRQQGAGATPVEVGQAAKNLGQEGTGFYQQHLIEPNQMQETGQGTVGDVYGRVTKNNRLLNPQYRKTLTVQTDAGLERNAERAEENARLNRDLYGTLSARSGLSPEDVQSVNQRGAGLQSLGDEIDAAQGMRAAGMKYGSGGQHIPYSNLDKVMRLVNALRGGEETVRGQQIRRLLEKMPGEAQPLPDTERMQQYRNAVTQEELAGESRRQGRAEANQATAGKRLLAKAPEGAQLGSTQPPQATVIPPPENYAQEFVNRLRQRAGENRAALPASEPPQEPRSTSPMDKYLTGARERQGLLRKEKK